MFSLFVCEATITPQPIPGSHEQNVPGERKCGCTARCLDMKHGPNVCGCVDAQHIPHLSPRTAQGPTTNQRNIVKEPRVTNGRRAPIFPLAGSPKPKILNGNTIMRDTFVADGIVLLVKGRQLFLRMYSASCARCFLDHIDGVGAKAVRCLLRLRQILRELQQNATATGDVHPHASEGREGGMPPRRRTPHRWYSRRRVS